MNILIKTALLLPGLLFAQSEPGFHEHDGFFLSSGIGPAFGAIALDASGTSFKKLEFSGGGIDLDFKIGGTVARTVSLSFDIITRSILAPDFKVDDAEGTTSNDISAGDVLIGLGITYYLMPANVFFNGTIGSSTFTIRDEDANVSASSERGFGFQVKAGKEWWMGTNWGLGLAAGYGYSAADDKKDGANSSYSGKMTTSKLFVLLNTTFN
jgi:hypothetical protein